jgi:hypothetical protein
MDEIDFMEYSTNALAQAAYVTNDSSSTFSFETGEDGDQGIGDWADSEYGNASQIVLTADMCITSASFKITGIAGGRPTGDITVRIETNNVNVPSGTLAHANAAGTVANADVLTSDWNLCLFTPFPLGAGTYWLVLTCPAQATNVRWQQSSDANGVAVSAQCVNGVWTNRVNNHPVYFRVYTKILQSYSESTIKTQGSYSLKGIFAVPAVGEATGGTITVSGSNTVHTFSADGSFVPVLSGTVQVEAWGGGGSGGYSSGSGGGGGGGGAYAVIPDVAVTAGTSYAVVVGIGGLRDNTGAPTNSTFATTVVVAACGTNSSSATGAAGGTEAACTGTTKAKGGAGANAETTHDSCGGGGGAGGADGDGADGVAGAHATGGGAGGAGDNGSGGTAGIGGGPGNINPAGDGGTNVKGGGGGGGGGRIGTDSDTGGNGGIPGGGGGGTDQSGAGANGARGQVIITYVTTSQIATRTLTKTF